MMTLPKWLNSRVARRGPVAIELDRWQLTGMLATVVVFCALAFFAGVLVGKRSAPAATAPVLAAAPHAGLEGQASATPTAARERHLALAEVSPGTEFVDHGLAQPIADPIPNDPTDAARMETHRQLQDFRAAGRHAEAPPLIGAPGASAVPVIITPSRSGAPSADASYTLQVSVFESIEPAHAIATELETAGYPVLVRELAAEGRRVYRVEVGAFKSAAAATTFQRRFERESGYSGVLVQAP